MTSSRLHQLSEQGQSVWVDFVSRQALEDGTIARMIREDAVVGLTSNPTIFQKAIAGGDAYDEQLREVLQRTEDGKEAFLALAVRDIQAACDLLRDAYDSSGGVDGFVSIEVDPHLADDRAASVDEAKRLKELVDRDNVYIKIPATPAGIGAIEDTIAAGIPVNVTLIFSIERHREVMEAYLRGLERLVESGGDPTHVPSVASFFVSRVDTEGDRRLEELGAPADLQGKLAVANAKLAYQAYQEVFSGPRFQALKAAGAKVQRPLWASTSTKNPAYRDVLYVEELIGPDTVNTMPPETIEAFQNHGLVSPTLEQGIQEAISVFDRIRAAGVDLDDVFFTLEREGVQKFADSFTELFEHVKAKRDELAAAAT
jgi:transaldolase